MSFIARRPLCGRIITSTLALASIAFVQPSTTPATTQPDLDQTLTQIDALAAQYKDLTASFTQLKYSPLLREPMETRGTIHAKGSIVLWRSDSPAVATRVTLQRLQIYYGSQKTIEDYPIAGKLGQLAASPLPRLAALRERFTIEGDAGEGLGIAGRTRAIAVRLVPIEAEVKQYVNHLRVLLDVERGLMHAFEMTDPDGERTLITFTNVQTNTGFADSALELNAPRDTKIVRPLEPGR